MCEHLPILGNLYAGCFCLYCSARLARIDADEDGQLFLEREERGTERRYVAVIHKDQQRPVTKVNLEQGRASLRFRGETDSTLVESTKLLGAFQNVEEVLEF
jgi:hypothetical protein